MAFQEQRPVAGLTCPCGGLSWAPYVGDGSEDLNKILKTGARKGGRRRGAAPRMPAQAAVWSFAAGGGPGASQRRGSPGLCRGRCGAQGKRGLPGVLARMAVCEQKAKSLHF